MSSARDSAPAVELLNVTKFFGRFAALRELSVAFTPGRLCGVFGGNGAGKSTMFRIIAALARPSRGEVRLFGDPDLRSNIATIGYMGHASLLYADLSAMENLRYFAGLYGMRGELAENVSRSAIEKVGLDPGLQRRVGDYSQGMRQRLALARAIIHHPRVLLLDEPFSNVDVASARRMAALLAALRNEGKTILVITHQATVLEEVADESILLDAGQVVSRQPGIGAATAQERRGLYV